MVKINQTKESRIKIKRLSTERFLTQITQDIQ